MRVHPFKVPYIVLLQLLLQLALMLSLDCQCTFSHTFAKQLLLLVLLSLSTILFMDNSSRQQQFGRLNQAVRTTCCAHGPALSFVFAISSIYFEFAASPLRGCARNAGCYQKYKYCGNKGVIVVCVKILRHPAGSLVIFLLLSRFGSLLWIWKLCFGIHFLSCTNPIRLLL